jgi:hypothetical protein
VPRRLDPVAKERNPLNAVELSGETPLEFGSVRADTFCRQVGKMPPEWHAR